VAGPADATGHREDELPERREVDGGGDLWFVKMDVPPDRSAGQLDRRRLAAPARGVEDVVAGIVDDGVGDARGDVLGRGDVERRVRVPHVRRVDVVDPDLLVAVGMGQGQPVRQPGSQPEGGPPPPFRVGVGVRSERALAPGIEEVDPETHALSEEPGVGPPDLIILFAFTELHHGVHPLGPPEQVDVLDLESPQESVHAGEPRARREHARMSLHHGKDDVRLRGRPGLLHVHLDVVEKTQVVDLLDRSAHFAGREDVALLQEDLAADHLFLGVGVAVHVDAVHVDHGTLRDHEMEIHVAQSLRPEAGLPLGLDLRPQISFVGIHVPQFLQGFVETVLVVEGSLLERDGLVELFVGEEGGPLERKIADGIAVPLVHREVQGDLGAVLVEFPGRFGDLHLQVAPVLVELLEFVEIGPERLLFEDLLPPELQDLLQLLRRIDAVPRHRDLLNEDPVPFRDEEGQDDFFILGVHGSIGFHLGVGVSLFPVDGEDLLFVLGDLELVEGIVHLGGKFVAELARGHLRVSLEIDPPDERAFLHLKDDAHLGEARRVGLVLQFLDVHLHLVEEARLEDAVHVRAEGRVHHHVAFAGFHVGEHLSRFHVVDSLDGEFLDDLALFETPEEGPARQAGEKAEKEEDPSHVRAVSDPKRSWWAGASSSFVFLCRSGRRLSGKTPWVPFSFSWGVRTAIGSPGWPDGRGLVPAGVWNPVPCSRGCGGSPGSCRRSPLRRGSKSGSGIRPS